MSPEHVTGSTLDERSDLFSLGVVLFEMATGTLPFNGRTPLATLSEVMHREHVRASSLAPGTPAQLDAIIDKALEKDRELRYQRASDLRTDLVRLRRDISSNRTVSLGPRSAPRPGSPNPPRRDDVATRPRVIEPWDAVARDGRDFAERGAGLMYWFRVPLGGVSWPDGFRSFLQPALDNPRITGIRFILDASVPRLGEIWEQQVLPLVQAWGARGERRLRIERRGNVGHVVDEGGERRLIDWLFTDLSLEFALCFKLFADDLEREVSGLGEAQVFLATATRPLRLADGSLGSVRIPDTILHARAPDDEAMLVALKRVARQWDLKLG